MYGSVGGHIRKWARWAMKSPVASQIVLLLTCKWGESARVLSKYCNLAARLRASAFTACLYNNYNYARNNQCKQGPPRRVPHFGTDIGSDGEGGAGASETEHWRRCHHAWRGSAHAFGGAEKGGVRQFLLFRFRLAPCRGRPVAEAAPLCAFFGRADRAYGGLCLAPVVLSAFQRKIWLYADRIS